VTGDHAAERALLDAVRSDPALLPEEKETTLRLGKREEFATVFTVETGIARRLLAHPHVPIRGLTVAEGDARRDVRPEDYTGGPIVGVRVRVPVGVLSVRSSPRSSTQHARIVTGRVLNEVGEA